MESQQSKVTFANLFARDIDKKINGVIKANDEKELVDEVDEYVLTGEIQQNLETFLEEYNDPANHTQNGAWISGFFGSGKSHLLKMLSHILGDVPRGLIDSEAQSQPLSRESIVRSFIAKANEQTNSMLAGELERALTIPATSILFNIDQKSDKGSVTALLYAFIRVFDEARGYYGRTPYVAKFEKDLDNNGQFEAFKEAFAEEAGKPWSEGRSEFILWDDEIGKAYGKVTGKSDQNVIAERYENSYRATVEDFANDVKQWLDRQPDRNHRIIFLVDEVGQFIGQNTELMLQLQSVAEDLAVKTNGRAWVVVTSQEDMDTIVGDRTKQQGYDFSKIQARFAIKLKLNSADVIEVIQKRLLAKKPEYEALMQDLWAEQGANLRTMFEFSRDSRKFSTSKAFTEEDFEASYPLVNYEFELFQTALRCMSQYNMFDGRHASVGERSMLAVVGSTLQQSKDSTVGNLIPFDRLYDGIHDAIQSTANYRILQAERVLDPDIKDLAVRLLKVLLLVKHVEGFIANTHNLRILLTDGFDTDLIDLERRIGEALRVLEHETYVQRVGESYEYLTNEEQDIEQEIKNIDIDHTSVIGEFKDILLNDIIGRLKVQYGPQKKDFDFGLRIDQVQQGVQRPIWLDVSTALDTDGREDARRVGMGARDTITLLLGLDDSTLLEDIRMYVKTNTYLRRTDSGNQSETRQRIIAGKRTAQERLRRELRTRVGNAIKTGTFVYNGETVDVKSSEPQARIIEGLQALIGRYYTNFPMLGGVRYEESGLATIIADAAASGPESLPGTDAARNQLDGPADDVLSFITREQKNNVTPTVKTIMARYDAPPYGWPFAAILACIGHLYGSERVELNIDGRSVQRTEAAQLLRNTKKQESIVVSVPKVYDPVQVRKLRDFARDFLDMSNADASSAPMELAEKVRDGLQEKASDLRRLRVQYATLPFIAQLDSSIESMAYAAQKGTTWLLDRFTNADVEHNAETLLDAKDDVIDPVLGFLHGNQRTVFADCNTWLTANKANMPLVSKETQELYRQATELMESPTLYRGGTVTKLKGLVESLKRSVDADVERERAAASESLSAILDTVRGSDVWENAADSARVAAESTLHSIRTSIDTTSVIANIQQIVNRAQEVVYPQLLDKLAASVPQPQPQPATPSDIPGDPSDVVEPSAPVQPTPVKRSVHINSIPRPHTKAMLESETDIDAFLEAYRSKLVAALEQGERILL